MPDNELKEDMKKDERTRALESNPCGICCRVVVVIREEEVAAVMADLNEETSGMQSELKNSPDVNAISQSLLDSKGWNLEEDADLIFEFSESHALFSIILNMESGSLVFRGNRELTEEEQKALGELFDAIENELNQFKNELISLNEPIDSIKVARDRNNLSIKIPDPKYYDLFIQKLIEKNLLPNNSTLRKSLWK